MCIRDRDVRAVNEAAVRVVARAREGMGPAFLALDTYRFHGHHVGDVDRAYYRAKKEEEQWNERDPIALLAAWLAGRRVEETTLKQIRAGAKQEVDAGVEFAFAAEYPPTSEVDEHVFA